MASCHRAYFGTKFMPSLEADLGSKRDLLDGTKPTLADIALASSLLPLYKFVWDQVRGSLGARVTVACGHWVVPRA